MNEQQERPMNVYQAINAVTADLAINGIAKTREGNGFMFRGIDDVYNALAPLLVRHGLVIVPRMLRRDVVERMSNNGKALFYVTLEAEFDFVATNDPASRHTARTFGEAMDSGDKATNKAMSAAYKYACFQTFAIPLVEGTPDSDTETHAEVDHQYAWIRQAVPRAIELNEKGDEIGAFSELYDVAMGDDNDAKTYCWSLLKGGKKGSTPQSRLRSMLKRLADRERLLAGMPSAKETAAAEAGTATPED